MSTYDSWISHRPLCCAANAFIQALLVCIIAAICVGQKKCIDVALLKQLCQINPVIQFALCSRLVAWVLWLSIFAVGAEFERLLTFHCPGERCPMVLMSNALMRISLLAAILARI